MHLGVYSLSGYDGCAHDWWRSQAYAAEHVCPCLCNYAWSSAAFLQKSRLIRECSLGILDHCIPVAEADLMEYSVVHEEIQVLHWTLRKIKITKWDGQNKRKEDFCTATKNMWFKSGFQKNLQNKREKSIFHFLVKAFRLIVGQKEALFCQ